MSTAEEPGPFPGVIAHWASIRHKHEAVLEFMGYLHSKGIELDFTNASNHTPMSVKVLVDDFFELNHYQLDKQRHWLSLQRRKAIEDGRKKGSNEEESDESEI
jgi:acyl transferase domain-containing protein